MNRTVFAVTGIAGTYLTFWETPGQTTVRDAWLSAYSQARSLDRRHAASCRLSGLPEVDRGPELLSTENGSHVFRVGLLEIRPVEVAA